jgi:Trypsin
MTARGYSLVGLAALVAALGACVAGAPEADSRGAPGDAVGQADEPIIGGTPATTFPEAALVDIQENGQDTMGCSGTVIAPYVVLTAGHCVADGNGWNITLPYASGQQVHGSSSATSDWTDSNDQVDPQEHDVALIFLDSPVTLSSYPTIATTGLADGSQVVTVGRVKDGQMSRTALYQSPPDAVTSGASLGFNYDYQAPIVIEHGDSGGASYIPGTHTIVSVNSTGNTTIMLIARVDLVSSWIAKQIASHTGGGGGQGAGGSNGGGEGGGPPWGGPPGGGEGGGPPWGGPPGWPPGGGPGGPPWGGPPGGPPGPPW